MTTYPVHEIIWSHPVNKLPLPPGLVGCARCKRLLNRDQWAAPCRPKDEAALASVADTLTP